MTILDKDKWQIYKLFTISAEQYNQEYNWKEVF
jgi:hypothetical protein